MLISTFSFKLSALSNIIYKMTSSDDEFDKEAEVSSLKQKRSSIKGQLTRFETFINGFDNDNGSIVQLQTLNCTIKGLNTVLLSTALVKVFDRANQIINCRVRKIYSINWVLTTNKQFFQYQVSIKHRQLYQNK